MTAWSRLVAGLALAALWGCGAGPAGPVVTFFNGEFALSVRAPADWKTEQAQQDGMWYRYFVSPPSAPGAKDAVSVVLFAGPFETSLHEYARSYIGAAAVSAAREETRAGIQGRYWEFAASGNDHALLLLGEQGRVYGLHAAGPTASFKAERARIDAMLASLNPERTADYVVLKDAAFGFSIRMPPAWKESRHFSGGGTLLLQYTSPPLAVDKGGQTVHAALTLTAEALPQDATLESFYDNARLKLGDAFKIAEHAPWGRSGFADVMFTETPISASRVKRFYTVAGGRGFSLAFEAREDVFPRASRWCDLIASTFEPTSAP